MRQKRLAALAADGDRERADVLRDDEAAALDEGHPFFQATYWHNRMFNPNLPGGIQILSFTPDWIHAIGYETAPEVDG